MFMVTITTLESVSENQRGTLCVCERMACSQLSADLFEPRMVEGLTRLDIASRCLFDRVEGFQQSLKIAAHPGSIAPSAGLPLLGSYSPITHICSSEGWLLVLPDLAAVCE